MKALPKHEIAKAHRLVPWHDVKIVDYVSNVKSAREFVKTRLEDIPRPIGRVLLDEYAKRYSSKTAKSPLRSANIYLRNVTEQVREICPFKSMKFLHYAEDLKGHAVDHARHCNKLIEEFSEFEAGDNYGLNIKAIYQRLAKVCFTANVTPPMGRCESKLEQMESGIVRMTREDWWERRFARLRDQAIEQIYIVAGIVRKERQSYASNHCVSEWRNQQKANAEYLESMDLVNEETEERFNLAEIAKATSSSPEHRRIELMVRCRGLEDLADDAGMVSYFVTWTAPSKYHPNSKKYNGSQPNETQAYLCNQWAKARAKLKRSEIEWFGVRVAEPHADACPHWHMLIFVRSDQKEIMQSVLADYATKEDKDELIDKRGNLNIKPRFDIEEIDRSKGSATGYIAKYISKNVDGEGLQNQPDYEAGNSSIDDSIARVTAWASRWRIRQFQFFGAAKISVWRECRRLKDPAEDAAFEKIRKAADSAKWAEFTQLIAENPVTLSYDKKKNEFNEITAKVIGLFFAGREINTRSSRFRLERRQAQSGGSRASWSPVSNCTGNPDGCGQDSLKHYDSLKKAVNAAGMDDQTAKILARGGRVVADDRIFVVMDGALRIFE